MDNHKDREVIRQLSYRIADLERLLAEATVDKKYMLEYINKLKEGEKDGE